MLIPLAIKLYNIINACLHAKSLQSCLTLRPWGLQPCQAPWDSPGKNTGVGCCALLQGIFTSQGLKPHLLSLLHWQVGPLPLISPEEPKNYKNNIFQWYTWVYYKTRTNVSDVGGISYPSLIFAFSLLVGLSFSYRNLATSMCHKHTKATNSNSLNLTIPSWESATYTFFTVFQIEFFIKF